MSRIIEAWEELLREAVTKDTDEREYALFRIGLILQRHNPNIEVDPEVHEENLSRDLQRLSLNEQRQRDVVSYLAELVRRMPESADSFIYAMSNARADILTEPLLDLLAMNGYTFKNDAAYQALQALNRCILNGTDDNLDAIADAPLEDLLDNWADSDDELLSEKAAQVQRRIDRLSEEEVKSKIWKEF